MKKKITFGVLSSMAIMFAILNILTIQVKNGENLTAYKALLQAKSLETLAEAGNLPENFPKDPWENETSADFGAKVRKCTNSYTYTYPKSGNLYNEYVYPVTTVTCCGSGEIPCVTNRYFGDRVFLRSLTEEEMRNLGLL